MCTASQISLIFGLFVGLLAISMPIYGAQLRKHENDDLTDIRRQAALGGLRGWAFRLGYPFVWVLYLPSHGFFFSIAIAALLMVPAMFFC